MLDFERKIDQLSWYNLVEKLKEILTNLPTETVTNTSALVNDGEDGTNPFITEGDIPEYSLSPISGSNELQLLKEGAPVATIDFTPYLDDTNLARLVSGQVSGTDLIVTRDDNTTFTIDVSPLIGGSTYGLTALNANNEIELLKDGSPDSTVDLSNLIDYTSTFTPQSGGVFSDTKYSKALRNDIYMYQYVDAGINIVQPFSGAIVIEFNLEDIAQGTISFTEFIHTSQNVNHFKEVMIGFRANSSLSVKVENTEPFTAGTFANRRMRIAIDQVGGFGGTARIYLGELTDTYSNNFQGHLDIREIFSSGTVLAKDVNLNVYGETTAIQGTVLYDSTN